MSNEDSVELFNTYTEDQLRFTQEEMDGLTAGGTDLICKRNSTIYNFGDQNQFVYYLRSGSAKYQMILPDGSVRTTAHSRAPSFIGIMNLLLDSTSINYCTAVTECYIRVCPINLFMNRLRDMGLTEKMLRFSLGASRHAYCNLIALLTEDRMILVDILRNQQNLTLQETADFIGCSRVHVSRICKLLKERDENL